MGCNFGSNSKGANCASNIRYILISRQSTNPKKTKSSHKFSCTMAANFIEFNFVITSMSISLRDLTFLILG